MRCHGTARIRTSNVHYYSLQIRDKYSCSVRRTPPTSVVLLLRKWLCGRIELNKCEMVECVCSDDLARLESDCSCTDCSHRTPRAGLNDDVVVGRVESMCWDYNSPCLFFVRCYGFIYFLFFFISTFRVSIFDHTIGGFFPSHFICPLSIYANR